MRNYDYSDLKDIATDTEHKQLMLEMLLDLDAFCAQHGLTYYLSGGTLLGAIRHKGFIPWDDDIDINMPRPDCEKLMELSGGRIGRFELVPPNYDVRTFSYHWKLYADSILVAKRAGATIGEKVYPVFMDIFPIEGLPDTDEGNVRHYREIRELKNHVNHARGLRIYSGRNPLVTIVNRLRTAYYSRVGVKKLFDRVIAHASSIGYEDSDFVGVMMTNVHTTEERVVKADYAQVVRLPFETHMASCPQGYDTYLRQLYGKKYMEWLPVHQRFPRHNLVTFVAYTPEEKAARAIEPLPRARNFDDTAEIELQFDEI